MFHFISFLSVFICKISAINVPFIYLLSSSVFFFYLKYLLNSLKLIIMAKVISMSLRPKSILGLMSGSLGDQVWCILNGKNYVRSKPTRGSKPKTAKQLDHSARFSLMVRFLKTLTPFLRIGFKSQTAKMSAFNAAMSYNLMNAIAGIYPDYCIDYSKVMVSMGTLPEALHPTAESSLAGEIEFSWEDNRNAMANDRVFLIIYNPAKEVATIEGCNARMEGGQTISLPADFSGDEVHCYIAFENAGQSVVSNSLYVGSLVVK